MMMRKQSILLNCAIFFTIILWVYAVGSKLMDFNQFRVQLLKQPFNEHMANALLYLLPAIETTAIGLLFFQKTRFSGFCLSLGLLSAFTIYIALVIVNFYDYVPCSCGGIFNKMSWRLHFCFNMAFVVITGYGTFQSALIVQSKRP